jgi:hypothetical protein
VNPIPAEVIVKVLPIPTDPTTLFKFDLNFELLLCNIGLPGVNPVTSDEVSSFLIQLKLI